jgi:hypothetical protein
MIGRSVRPGLPTWQDVVHTGHHQHDGAARCPPAETVRDQHPLLPSRLWPLPALIHTALWEFDPAIQERTL